MMPMTGADPVQQKMMLFMPIMFTFLFITSPAGWPCTGSRATCS
jgi:membrane protein insertase Oxa1/YidC/SpoIIIJ